MPFPTRAVANYILKRAKQHSMRVSPMKLQKLVYISHGWHMALTVNGELLIDEQVEAWQYGPVIPSLYHTFKRFGSHPIDELATETVIRTSPSGTPILDVETFDIDDSVVDREKIVQAKSVMDQVITIYGSKSGVWLSNLTHKPGSPWQKVYEEKWNNSPPPGTDIDTDIIRDHYRALAQKRAAG